MTRRQEEHLHPAQEQLLVQTRDGGVEGGTRATVLDSDSGRTRRVSARKLSLECSACGYGIVRAQPPERCPMCHAVAAWMRTPRSRFVRVLSTRTA